jgi:trk system potassium uptake protein TrkH
MKDDLKAFAADQDFDRKRIFDTRLFSWKSEPLLKKRINPMRMLFFGLFFSIFIGSILLWLPISHNPGISLHYIDSLFISTSATTVTGLATVDIADTFSSFGQAIILILLNLGGLGYMTLISFFLLSGRMFSMNYVLYVKEALNLPSLGDILNIAKRVFGTIIFFELAGTLILSVVWADLGFTKSLWYGLFHSMSAFNNSGLDLMGGFKSFTAYSLNIPLNLTIMALIFLGGIGFMVVSDIINVLRHKKAGLSLHSRVVLVTSFILIIAGAIGFFFLETNHSMEGKSLKEKLMISLFTSVTSRTAGFATIDLSAISTPAIIILCILMFIGASPGSTGSGIKTSTFAILVLWLVSIFRHGEEPEAFGRSICKDNVEKAMALFLLSIITVTFFIFFISFIENFPLEKIAFEVCSAFGTVGLSTGITPFLHSSSKLALVVLMFIGRLTPLTILQIFAKPHKSRIKSCNEMIAVG